MVSHRFAGSSYLACQAREDWDIKCTDNPVFILERLIMGFVAVRFWTD